MPNVLSPSSKSYAPLADEVNPSFGNMAPAPVVTRNSAIVYGKRSSSTISASSGESEDLERAGGQLQSQSEETLSPSANPKGKGRAIDDEMGDVGEVHRTVSAKGKERAWDVEQGPRELHDQQASEGAYPPMNEVEEEERRIQQNLARFAAKDMARRRAARESRQLPPNAGPSSPRSSSSTTSFSRRPFSVLSTKPNRNSIMGMMEGIWPGSPKKDEGWNEGELPMTNSPVAQSQPYPNPYDTQPSFSPVPKMVVSPTSPKHPSPFADPPPPAPVAGSSSHHRRPSLVSATSSGSAQSPLTSPIDGPGFAYGGPTWRGGQAVQQQEEENRKSDKWWHALCAWGSDLDGGYDANQQGGQVGRTNPFE
ncbi:hypothetical protein L486_08302 [Kwoniella mangroviensis CBS 10435]|uniref:Uncharacterized protein n=1 Tax=Kwoniella mangroviensis CBS 10435 TaxID=1331196 RepID=A0A1B9IEI6_9TREE|nr:uncharacterized protein I203_05110 [Kwoniella mangroviensis CBS 8507]OCF54108.1 hypothetical protein L486_08302 [Kwoniella mangroviensis CBS 10435]OCF66085.1 hypothetical protein I203_05110 [Kwoniella mangroviensis CBS 8507]OCF71840.1 hypothetical protein I204_07100 [Kwoniella mangroviensis CBS 8886]